MTEDQSKELLSKTLLEAMNNKKVNNAQLGELIGADKSTVGRWINKEALLKVNFIPHPPTLSRCLSSRRE